MFKLVEKLDKPIIFKGAAGTEDIKYGFEGGTVIEINGKFHLFTSEMTDDPFWVKMKLSHWVSDGGKTFKRMSTLMESSGDFTGDDPRAALWSPIPTFDEQNGYWYMTYVAYRAAPNTEKQHRINMDGKIWLSRSETPGIEGIGGPYEDLGIILQKDENADLWEGLQGSDSFYPYRLGDIWYSFYGSCDTQSLPIKWWGVGLAMAPTLQGPWTRCTKMNPVLINDIFTENPIVTKIDGLYYAFYDGGNKMGYSISEDGIHWSKGHEIMFERTWEKNVRTPLSCIALGEGLYSVFYTAYDENGFGCVGNMTIKK